MEVIRNFEELVSHLSQRTERRRVAVVCPNDHSSQEAVARALDEGIADILIVGADEEAKAFFAKYGERVESVDASDVDEAATKAVALVREGRADVLMKGLLNTDNLLRAVLNKETGILPKGRVLTHIACAQMPQYDRLLFCTDVAVIPRPTKEQREEQLRYLMDLKTSLSEAALKKKHLESPIEGKADALIFPGIQSGNVFYKAITLFCQADTAAILKGPQVPVVLTSRGDSPASKFYSLALACL